MTIEKKLDRPILSLVDLRLVISPLIEVRRGIGIIVEGFDQVAKMAEPQLLVSILPKSKKRTKIRKITEY